MTAGVDNKYRVARGDAVADRERILELWERSGFESGPSARARYDWFYLRNPAGHGRVYLLFADQVLVGAVGAGTRLIARNRKPPLRAAILVDFVVDPAHRSMFPALALQRAAREHELRDVQAVYGLPAEKAVPIFRRLGASAELFSGNHVRVLHSPDFIKRRLPGLPAWLAGGLGGLIDRARLVLPWLICRAAGVRSQWSDGFPPDIDAFWERVAAGTDRATGVRHREFLEWRFHASPQRGWQILEVSDRSGRLAGYFVCLRDGDELHVSDLLLDDSAGGALPLQALALAAWRLGARTVRIVFGGSERMHRTLSRCGYLLRDQRPCFLIQPAGADAAELPGDWWLTRADEDV